MGCWSNDLLSRLAPKNPIIASLFRNIGYEVQLGSGVRNLYKYSKYYSGKEPEFIGENIESAILDLIALDTTLSQSQIAKHLKILLEKFSCFNYDLFMETGRSIDRRLPSKRVFVTAAGSIDFWRFLR